MKVSVFLLSLAALFLVSQCVALELENAVEEGGFIRKSDDQDWGIEHIEGEDDSIEEGKRYERGLKSNAKLSTLGSYSAQNLMGRLGDSDRERSDDSKSKSDRRGHPSFTDGTDDTKSKGNSRSTESKGRHKGDSADRFDSDDDTRSKSSRNNRKGFSRINAGGRDDGSKSKSNSRSSDGRKGHNGGKFNPNNRKNGAENNGGRDRGSNIGGPFNNKQKGVSTGPEQPEAIEKGPCDHVKCKGLFQMPVPPSCECRCPGPANHTCPPQKIFEDNICECVCSNIVFNCPGNFDFDFDTCSCVCGLQKRYCGPRKRLDSGRCTCLAVSPPPTLLPPSRPACSLQCRGPNQYLERQTCQCRCQRFLIKKTSLDSYRHGRSLNHEADFEGELEDELQQRRSLGGWRFNSLPGSHSSQSDSSKSRSGSRSGSNGRVGARPPLSPVVYSPSCPAGRRADHKTCVCYW